VPLSIVIKRLNKDELQVWNLLDNFANKYKLVAFSHQQWLLFCRNSQDIKNLQTTKIKLNSITSSIYLTKKFHTLIIKPRLCDSFRCLKLKFLFTSSVDNLNSTIWVSSTCMKLFSLYPDGDMLVRGLYSLSSSSCIILFTHWILWLDYVTWLAWRNSVFTTFFHNFCGGNWNIFIIIIVQIAQV